jgi:hypothetical protein
LQRPLQLKTEGLIAGASVEELVQLSTDHNFAAAAGSALAARGGAAELVELMYSHPEDSVRRQATALAGGLANQDPGLKLDEAVLERLRFHREGAVPWAGGALYVPALQRDKEACRALLHELFAWWLALTGSERAAEAQQAWNSLYSRQLLDGAGYPMTFSADPTSVLQLVAKHGTRGEARRLLVETGLERKYGEVLR